MNQPTDSSKVLIVGGGVAAIETLLALRDLAGDRVAVTLVAPETAFTYRPMKVAAPFALGHAASYELDRIAADLGATFVRDRVAEVLPEQRRGRRASRGALLADRPALAPGAEAGPR